MENIFKKRLEQLNRFQSSVRRKSDGEKKEIPDNVFKTCEKCNTTFAYSIFQENLYVCKSCNHHIKITARERVRQLIDDGKFIEFYGKAKTINSDNFDGYDEKLNKASMQTGLNEAVITGTGKINGNQCALAIMDSHFMMGSMGSVVGEKITRLIEYATRKKLPLIIFCTSGGARMQEGIISLMQMSKTSSALKKHSDKGLLYISVLTHPTTGGVSASFAMLGDIIISEPQALIGFAGKRVIEKTINEVLPPEFQSAEFVLEKGFVDMIVNRKDMKSTLAKLLQIHGRAK